MFWMLMIVVAGVLTGSYGLPMKYTAKWKWEHTWAVFAFWTMLVLPFLAGWATVPRLFVVLSEAGASTVLTVFLLGCLWGVSSVAFGYGLYCLGLGLGYTLMLGLIISVGALIPLFSGDRAGLSLASTLTVLGGVAVILLGVALSAWAAVIKEKVQNASPSASQPMGRRRLIQGVVVCAVTGVAAPMLNLAFGYGEAIRMKAVELGASNTLAPNAVWLVTLLGGFVVTILYTLAVVHKNGSWRTFVAPGTGVNYFYTLSMGLIWGASIQVYGMAAANLGELGDSAGWAAFNAVGIVAANCLGLLTREWKGVGAKGMSVMAAGLAVLVAGIVLMGLAKTL